MGASSNSFNLVSQEDIAKELHVSVQTLHNYKKLAEMIPELQEVIEDGTVSPEVARAITKMLTTDRFFFFRCKIKRLHPDKVQPKDKATGQQ